MRVTAVLAEGSATDPLLDPAAGGSLSRVPFEGFVSKPKEKRMELTNAWSLALAASLAYREEDEIRKVVTSWGFDDVKFFGFEKGVGFRYTQVYLATKADLGLVLVSFRGTETTSWRDWLRNANVLPDNGPFQSAVHRGFLAALREKCQDGILIDKVVEKTVELKGEDGHVFVTGHSLGAAVATLASAFMLDSGLDLTGVYTYGSPRVGGKQFAQRYDSRGKALLHRFVNGQDIFTQLPNRNLDFEHVGTQWYITDDGVVAEPSWWRKLMDFLRFSAIVGDENLVADHDLNYGYIPALKEAMERAKRS